MKSSLIAIKKFCIQNLFDDFLFSRVEGSTCVPCLEEGFVKVKKKTVLGPHVLPLTSTFSQLLKKYKKVSLSRAQY